MERTDKAEIKKLDLKSLSIDELKNLINMFNDGKIEFNETDFEKIKNEIAKRTKRARALEFSSVNDLHNSNNKDEGTVEEVIENMFYSEENPQKEKFEEEITETPEAIEEKAEPELNDESIEFDTKEFASEELKNAMSKNEEIKEEIKKETDVQEKQDEEKPVIDVAENLAEDQVAEKEDITHKQNEKFAEMERSVNEAMMINKDQEEEIRKLDFENRMLKISDLEDEPQREDYDFTDQEWLMVYGAWLDKHPEHMKSTEPEESVLVEETRKKSGFGKLLILLLVALALVAGALFARSKLKEKAMKESYDKLQNELVLSMRDNGPILIEAGEEFTYSQNSSTEISQIPDQIRPYVLAAPEGAKIEIGNLDNSQVGEQQLEVTIIKEDEYGQEVSNKQYLSVLVEDNQEPIIELGASRISVPAGNIQAILDNVKSVVDPTGGEYRYSTDKIDGTYYVDTGRVDINNSGTYPVTVIIYDHGNQIEQTFEVEVVGRITGSGSSNNQNNSTNNQTSENDNSQSNTPVYYYVDEEGNRYTEEEVKQMLAEGTAEIVR